MSLDLIIIGSAVTALATSLGALPALFVGYLSKRWNNLLMGFSAGVMLSASAFSLILPALELSKTQFHQNSWLAPSTVGVYILIGALFLLCCNRFIPHEHFVSGREGKAKGLQLKRIWLFVFAIAIHNLPEGLAVGSGAGSHSVDLALPILLGIGLQDIPEGFVVAVALMSVGYSKHKSLAISVLTGVVEAAAAVLGFFATSFFAPLLPVALAFAGGAMVYVVVEEMIPEIHLKSVSNDVSIGIMVGFVLMMVLDFSLGA